VRAVIHHAVLAAVRVVVARGRGGRAVDAPDPDVSILVARGDDDCVGEAIGQSNVLPVKR
jgi:hypothetical protein